MSKELFDEMREREIAESEKRKLLPIEYYLNEHKYQPTIKTTQHDDTSDKQLSS